ncbi:MAG: LptE family protein [Verrucomicrobia bacterium]|nr:LptE family protein [Verrucomicrobiota bacterium]
MLSVTKLLAWPALVLAACALLVGSGCANYRLGTGTKLAFRTLYLEPVENKTLLPQARALVSTQLREAFARDPRITLVNSAADAEATLAVTITSYRRDVLTVREGDTGLARKFNVTLSTTCTLRDRSGKALFENRPVETQREVFTDSGQLQSEYQTLPLLAESLAAKAVHAALDVW